MAVLQREHEGLRDVVRGAAQLERQLRAAVDASSAQLATLRSDHREALARYVLAVGCARAHARTHARPPATPGLHGSAGQPLAAATH
jgi:hypothetical protein